MYGRSILSDAVVRIRWLRWVLIIFDGQSGIRVLFPQPALRRAAYRARFRSFFGVVWPQPMSDASGN